MHESNNIMRNKLLLRYDETMKYSFSFFFNLTLNDVLKFINFYTFLEDLENTYKTKSHKHKHHII